MAHLTAEEDRLRLLQLRGGSSITPAPAGPGSLQQMTGRDIDLSYGEDGETIEHALIVGSGVIRVAGETPQTSRRISAETFDVPLGARGTRPTALTARDRVEMELPAEKGAAARIITSETLDGKGDETNGLTSAVFAGKVVFRERAADVDRSATSELLQVALKPGFSAIDEATFLRPVEFVDGRMTARAARGRYALAAGVLDLSGSEPGFVRPNVRDDRINIDADGMVITLDGPSVLAKGSVRTALQPSKGDADSKTPVDVQERPAGQRHLERVEIRRRRRAGALLGRRAVVAGRNDDQGRHHLSRQQNRRPEGIRASLSRRQRS